VLPKSYISASEHNRKSKKKPAEDSFPEMSEEMDELDIKDLEDLQLDVEDDFLDDDLEGMNISVSSGTDNRKLTKRQ
jgi:hypothetical protein